MLRLRMKQFLKLFLCGLLAYPVPVVAESAAEAPPDTVLRPVANISLMSYAGRQSVTESSVNLLQNSGVQLATLRAREVRLFEEASAAAPAFPPSPQIGGGGGTNRGWLVALGIAIVGTSLAIAALVRANDVGDRSR